ncbi:elongation factor P [bacterium]|nr:elongation factor P [bacterium]
MAVIANDLKKGMAVKKDGDIFVVLGTVHRTPGNKRAFVQATFRSLRSGQSSDHRLASDDRLESVSVSRDKWEFSYHDNTGYTFINPENYENLTQILFIEGKAVSVEPPASAILKVIESPEGVRGDSANNVMKVAKLETGLQLQVPLFIKEGELIRVDTREKKYMGRA